MLFLFSSAANLPGSKQEPKALQKQPASHPYPIHAHLPWHSPFRQCFTSLPFTHSAPVSWAFFLFLQYTRTGPFPRPLHRLHFLPGTHSPNVLSLASHLSGHFLYKALPSTFHPPIILSLFACLFHSLSIVRCCVCVHLSWSLLSLQCLEQGSTPSRSLINI